MKRQTSRAALFLLATLTLISWLGASFLAQRAGELSRGAVIRWEAGGGISPVQLLRAERYAREDGGAAVPTAALWREHREGYVEDGAGRRSTSAAVLELFGDGGEVWPAAFRYGNYPARGDETGCAVDEATADALWGSARVVGQAVLWKGKTDYVRGVMKGSGGLLLVQGGEDAEPWPNLLLRFRDGDAGTQAEHFLSQNQIPGGQMLDLSLLHQGLTALAALPGAALTLGILLRLFQRGRALTAAPLLLVCYLPPALLGAGAVLWCAGAPAVLGRDGKAAGLSDLGGRSAGPAVWCPGSGLCAAVSDRTGAGRFGRRAGRGPDRTGTCCEGLRRVGAHLRHRSRLCAFWGCEGEAAALAAAGGVVAVGLVPGAAPPFFGSEKRGGTGR